MIQSEVTLKSDTRTATVHVRTGYSDDLREVIFDTWTDDGRKMYSNIPAEFAKELGEALIERADAVLSIPREFHGFLEGTPVLVKALTTGKILSGVVVRPEQDNSRYVHVKYTEGMVTRPARWYPHQVKLDPFN